MVTERNDISTESQVETTEVPLDTPAPTETETVTEQVEQPTPEVESNESIEVVAESAPQPQSEASTPVQSSEEFRKYQSSTDRRMADLESKLQESETARVQAEQRANLDNLNQEVQAYEQQLRTTYINQGMDDVTAGQIAQQNANMAKEAYTAKLESHKVAQQQREIEAQLNTRTQLAKAYELASQYKVPYAELQDFPDPVSMERHAKALSRIQGLEGRIQQVTPPQQLAGSAPSADVAPTNAEDVLDRYNAGDSAITTEMARSAAQRLGMTIFG